MPCRGDLKLRELDPHSF